MEQLPLPEFFDPQTVGQVWRVPYEQRADEAAGWATRYNLRPAAEDRLKFGLLLIDVQNTFCIPDYELYVGGRSGTGAVDDNRRLCTFIYRNLGRITHITATLDTHLSQQIFHALFLVDGDGNHPAPYTLVTTADIRSGRWKFNPALAASLQTTPQEGQQRLEHYVSELETRGKYELTVWPYHAMLGGTGHALVPAVEEAVFFHSVARLSQPDFEIKGDRPFTENYSAIGPEVLAGPRGESLGTKNENILAFVKAMDAVYVAGQAKSHCVAWTVSDLLDDIQATDPALASRIYLLEDCSSPVVVPGVVDYTDQAEAAYARFAAAGMHRVRSDQPVSTQPPSKP